jgi:bile acid:Na+ symporter, BASS family
MESIDSIKIHFSQDNLMVLNICLALIMFSIALDIRREDFASLWQNPKPAVVGMVAQLILLPITTIILVFIFNPPPSVAFGMVAISACPGGNNSNYSTYLSKGNTALAITTTSISVIVCMVTMPLYIWLGAKVIPNISNLQRDVRLDPFEMAKIVGLLILLPLVLGMAMRQNFPALTERIYKPFKTMSMILFFGLIIGALLSNIKNIKDYVGQVFLVVAVLNALALSGGYYFAKINGLSEVDRRAITFETGIHNVTLALIVIFNFFDGLGGMALVAAWYGIWDLLTGFALAITWGKMGVKNERKLKNEK